MSGTAEHYDDTGHGFFAGVEDRSRYDAVDRLSRTLLASCAHYTNDQTFLALAGVLAAHAFECRNPDVPIAACARLAQQLVSVMRQGRSK